MTARPLECAEIRAELVEGGVPAGPDVEAHLQGCPECRELLADDARLGRGLAQGAVVPEPNVTSLFAIIERKVDADTGVRAKLRALPTSQRTAVVVGVALALVAGHALFWPREELGGPYSPIALWLLVAVLLSALVAGSRFLLRGVTRGSMGREPTVSIVLLGLPLLVALLAPLGALQDPEALAAWGNPAACFSYGALTALPLVGLYWLFERRDRMPLWTLVSAGALGGIAANALLHCHCASAHLPHLLLGHASIGLAWAGALAASASLSRSRS